MKFHHRHELQQIQHFQILSKLLSFDSISYFGEMLCLYTRLFSFDSQEYIFLCHGLKVQLDLFFNFYFATQLHVHVKGSL